MNYFQLLNALDSLYWRLEGKTVSIKTIVNNINQIINFNECRITGIGTLAVISNDFVVSGMYDPDLDKNNKPCIEVEIAFPKTRKAFILDEFDLTYTHWSTMSLDLVGILGHEFMHLNQYRKRNFRSGKKFISKEKNTVLREQQEYYGLNDEIDAYAFTAAAVMAYALPKKPMKFEKTIMYTIYSSVFGKNHEVVLKLKNLTEKYYKRLERQYYGTAKL